MLTDARGSTNHRPPYPPAYPYKPGGSSASSPPVPRTRCCCCPAKLSASACTCLGVCVLVLGYTLLGAFTFMALEGGFSQTPPPKNPQTLSADMRSRTVERLWSITEDLNILYKDNWTRLAAQEVLKFQDTLVQSMRTGGKTGGGSSGAPTHYNQQHRWSFASSFLYSLTLITTIGYGSVAPRSSWGRAVTVLYALLGIPLMLVYLSTVGEVLARSFRRLYSRMRCKQQPRGAKKQPSDAHAHCNNVGHFNSSESDDLSKAEHGSNLMILDCGGESIAAGGQAILPPKHGLPEVVRVPISLCLAMVVLYICGGALLFNRLENWTFLEGSFFCFTSLGTIGFGDMVPGHYHSSQNTQASSGLNPLEQISIFITSAYILVGMAVIAMCFNLVQDEVVVLVRKFGKYFGVSNGGYHHRGDDDQGMTDEGEGIAMAVVGAGSTS